MVPMKGYQNMRINSITSSYYMQNYRSNKNISVGRTRNENKTDQVTFSDEAVSFSKTLSDIKEKIVIRANEEQTKIDDIKNLIEKGQYNVESELVAEKILQLFKSDKI